MLLKYYKYTYKKYGFKVHLKVMLAPANYYFLHQELSLVYMPVKKLHSAPLTTNQFIKCGYAV